MFGYRRYNKRLKLLLFCKLSNKISHVIGGKFNPGLTTTWKQICCKILFNSISTHHAQQLRGNTFHLLLNTCWYGFFLIQPFSANSAESKAAISCGETVLSRGIIKFVLLAHIFHHFALFVVQL